MRTVMKVVALSIITAGWLAVREAGANPPSGQPCPTCGGGIAPGFAHSHGLRAGRGQGGSMGGCGDDNIFCPVYPQWVYYQGARKLPWGQSLNPWAQRYRVTEIQVFQPLPYSMPRVPAPTTVTTTTGEAAAQPAPIVPEVH